MSKHETPLTLWYWHQVGGTLCEEYLAVPRSPTNGQRLLDAVIVLGGPKKRVHWRDLSLEGEDVVVVQTKAHRLGMYLAGQAILSRELVKNFGPRSIRSVALCKKDDAILVEQFEGVEVVVVPRGIGDDTD